MDTVAIKPRKPTIVTLAACLIFGAIVFAGCDAAGVVAVHNIANATGGPRPITVTPQVVSAATTPQTGMDGMPGMPMTDPTTPAGASSAATSVTEPAPASTDYVLIWILFGTPTPTQSSRGAVAQATRSPGTAVSAAATPVPANTLPPTATRRATATNAGAQNSANPGNPEQGKLIFGTIAGCTACHDVSTGAILVGPSLKGVASRAATRKPGMAASDYIRESILTPNAYVVSGFQPGIMLQNFAQVLTPQQVNDVIAYLLTLN
jgi:cytochrome c2